MANEICIFIGSANSFNVQQTANNVIQLLSDAFEIHLVMTESAMFDRKILNKVNVFGEGAPSTRAGEIKAIMNYFRKNDPTVATHITEPPIHGTFLIALAHSHGVPVVYRYSGDRFYEYRLSFGWRRVTHFGLNNVLGRIPLVFSDACIALGPTGKTRLTDRGVDPNQIVVLPPPVDQKRFKQDHEPPQYPLSAVPNERAVALFVGRRSYRKGFDTLESTIPRILNRREDIQFVIVGGGERIPQVSDQYADHITVVGRVPPESMVDYFYHANVLIHPSLTEGVSRTLVEALMCGTPVIARDVGDLASVTSNLFATDAEFVDMICEFEDLPLDDPQPFSMTVLKDHYVSFFTQFT